MNTEGDLEQRAASSSPVNDTELTKRLELLQTELQETKGELEECRKRSTLIEQLYVKTKEVNEELQKEIETLNKLLDNRKKVTSLKSKDVGTQVFEHDLLAEMSAEDIHLQLESEKLTAVKEAAVLNPDPDPEIGKSMPDWVHTEEPTLEETEEGEVQEEAMSVAESLREAAESALQQSGFVYDEASGMYYDHGSGYYYDSERQLYYEPTQGVYYSYDPETQAYTVHSQVDLSQYPDYYGKQQSAASGESQGQMRKRSMDSGSDMTSSEKKKLKANEKNKVKKAKVVSYASSAKTYSRDLKSRRVTKEELLLASVSESAKHHQSKCKGVVTKDTSIDLQRYDSVDYQQWSERGRDDNDYYDEVEYQQKINRKKNVKHFTRKRPVMKQQTEEADKRVTNLSFIGPILPKELAVVETNCKNESATAEREKLIDNPNSAVSDFNIDKPLKPDLKMADVDENSIKDRAEILAHNNDSSNLGCDTDNGKTEISSTFVKSPNETVLDSLEQKAEKTLEVAGPPGDTSVCDTNKTESDCAFPETVDVATNDLEEGEISDSESETETALQEIRSDTEKCAQEEVRNNKSGMKGVENKDQSEREEESEGASCESSDESEQEDGAHSQQYPPCIRMIVTSSEHLTPGSLYVVTCSGATAGRDETLRHAIVVPHVHASKMHCSIKYNDNLRTYLVQDHASLHGTYLNGQRLSKAQKVSDAFRLEHGDELTIADTTLLCHIHAGSETCAQCEPGVVQSQLLPAATKAEPAVLSKSQKEKVRRQQMKQIKKKYGLQGDSYIQDTAAINNPNYEDKAGIRRKTKGSDNPYQADEAPASVNVPLSKRNVGHKLLEKMGWKEGQSLGKSSDGILEPVQAELRSSQSAGLGSGSTMTHTLDYVHNVERTSRWLKARDRYDQTVTQSSGGVPEVSQGTAKTRPLTFVKGTTLTPSKTN